MRRAVFLDRDGVINRSIVRDGKPYAPTSWFEIEILPDVLDALVKLRRAGYLNVVITNQPDISTGLQTQSSVDLIHKNLKAELALDAFFICPHVNADRCECRKPMPGLLMQAAKQFDIDISQSYLVGDRWRDIEAGQKAGCAASFFVDYGYHEPRPYEPYTAVANLSAAAKLILSKPPLI